MQTLDTIVRFPFGVQQLPPGSYEPYADSAVVDSMPPGPFIPFGFRDSSASDTIITLYQPSRPDYGIVRNKHSFDWITGILILCFALLAWARFNYNRRLKQIFYACLSARFVTQLQREGNLFNEQIMLALGTVYVSTFSLIMYIGFQRYDMLSQVLLEPPLLFIGFIVLAVIFWLIKTAANHVIAFIFKTSDAADSYLLNSLLFNLTIGLVLLPLLPLVIYTGSDTVFWFAVAITAILLLYRILRSILIGLSQTSFPLLYLLIFIFSLEILPVLVIIKSLMLYTDMHQRFFSP
ncbi:MAG: DUF4271 domain-containing protein [Bacteroidales bacterium]|nr:DUF4271 domain-containing protein [Bacteroidales bacterium]MDZ4203956.1 DUF4271 domain-containing protein [Bacteroidales bacterium]